MSITTAYPSVLALGAMLGLGFSLSCSSGEGSASQDGGSRADVAAPEELRHSECFPTSEGGCEPERFVPGWECCPVTVHQQLDAENQCLTPSDGVRCFATAVGGCFWGEARTCYSVSTNDNEPQIVVTNGFFQERDEVREIGMTLCEADVNRSVRAAPECPPP